MTVIKHEFNQAQLDARIERSIDIYKNMQARHDTRGAIILVSASTYVELLETFAEYRLKGFTFHPTMPQHFSPTYSYVYMLKPEREQQKEIEQIKVSVESEYRESLEVLKQQHIEAVAQQTVAMKRKQREEELAAQELAELEAARAEAAALFADEVA